MCLKNYFHRWSFFVMLPWYVNGFFWSVMDQKLARYRSGWVFGGCRERTASWPPRSKRDNFLIEQAILKRRVVFLWNFKNIYININIHICDLRISLKITKKWTSTKCAVISSQNGIYMPTSYYSFVTIYLKWTRVSLIEQIKIKLKPS